MRNSWIEQLSIEFDDEGEIDIYFVPIRPGTQEFFIEGMVGTFAVK